MASFAKLPILGPQLSVIFISFQTQAAPQEAATIRLECAWSSSADAMTGSPLGETTGTKLITIHLPQRGKAVLHKEGLGAAFHAGVTTEQIEAETTYKIGPIQHREQIIINRFTGTIENRILLGDPPTDGIVHYGKCKALPSRLF